MQDLEIPEFSHPLLWIEDQSENVSLDGARMLPPKLYLVVLYQTSLVNRTRITCSDFRRPLEVLLESACYTISHVHTPWGNCNKCPSMIVSVKTRSLRLYLSIRSAHGVFSLGYYWLLNKRLIISEFFTPYLQSWGGWLGIYTYWGY